MKHTERDNVRLSARNLRLDAGLASHEVAVLMGISPSAVSRFERRRSAPAASTIINFLRAVNRPDLADEVQVATNILEIMRGGREPRSTTLLLYAESTGRNDLADLMRAISR